MRETEPTVETDSTRTSANIDRTEKDVDRRAEAVFAKLAWRLCGSSFDTPWLEALLLNLLFHGYLSMRPSVMASQKARHQLCRSCQRHLKLEPKPDEAEAQTFDLQSHLAAAIFFLLGTSYKSVNADVYVHDASTTDLNVPRDSYRIGPPDSLLVPIFRLYCFQNGQYAALLPLLVSAAACCCLLLPAATCCCLLLPACCSLLLPAAGAAAGGCCCCCGAAAIKQPPKQETNSQTPFSKHLLPAAGAAAGGCCCCGAAVVLRHLPAPKQQGTEGRTGHRIAAKKCLT